MLCSITHYRGQSVWCLYEQQQQISRRQVFIIVVTAQTLIFRCRGKYRNKWTFMLAMVIRETSTLPAIDFFSSTKQTLFLVHAP